MFFSYFTGSVSFFIFHIKSVKVCCFISCFLSTHICTWIFTYLHSAQRRYIPSLHRPIFQLSHLELSRRCIRCTTLRRLPYKIRGCRLRPVGFMHLLSLSSFFQIDQYQKYNFLILESINIFFSYSYWYMKTEASYKKLRLSHIYQGRKKQTVQNSLL